MNEGLKVIMIWRKALNKELRNEDTQTTYMGWDTSSDTTIKLQILGEEGDRDA